MQRFELLAFVHQRGEESMQIGSQNLEALKNESTAIEERNDRILQ
jgi:hypothetical protein